VKGEFSVGGLIYRGACEGLHPLPVNVLSTMPKKFSKLINGRSSRGKWMWVLAPTLLFRDGLPRASDPKGAKGNPWINKKMYPFDDCFINQQSRIVKKNMLLNNYGAPF
jgi:hypothetical protein